MSLTPLFLLTDKLQSFKAKLTLFCGELGITLMELDGDESLSKAFEPDPHPIVLWPIVTGPDVGVAMMNPEDPLEDLGLDEEQLLQIKTRVDQVHQANFAAVENGLGDCGMLSNMSKSEC